MQRKDSYNNKEEIAIHGSHRKIYNDYILPLHEKIDWQRCVCVCELHAHTTFSTLSFWSHNFALYFGKEESFEITESAV